MVYKSAKPIFSKIKREFKSFASVNLLNDNDFPDYTAEILKRLGKGIYKESEAIIHIVDGKSILPNDFKLLHAAFKCNPFESSNNTSHLQNKSVVQTTFTKEILKRDENCEIVIDGEERIERLTVRYYVNDAAENFIFNRPVLLRLSPNAKQHCVDNCMNLLSTSLDEITINNNKIYSNFKHGSIYIQYYSFVLDEDNIPMIPDIIEVEKAVEWYIKWQILLNYWFVDDLSNSQNKWQKAEQMFNDAFAEAKYIIKLPSFSTLVNWGRNMRSINKVSFFSQIDKKR